MLTIPPIIIPSITTPAITIPTWMAIPIILYAISASYFVLVSWNLQISKRYALYLPIKLFAMGILLFVVIAPGYIPYLLIKRGLES